MMIYRRELRSHCKSLLIWSAGMIFLVLAGMGKYEAGIGLGKGSMTELFAGMPESLKSIFGIGILDLSKATEYYAVLFLYISLMLSLYAVITGTGIIVKEERDKTVEFLLVKPISRGRIFEEKLLAGMTLQFILCSVTFFVSATMLAKYVGDSSYLSPLLRLSGSSLALQMLFLSLGCCLGGISKHSKRSSMAAAGILVTMYLLSVLIDLSENLRVLRFVTFFKYFDPRDIIVRGYWWGYTVITALLIMAFIGTAVIGYRRRDMRL